jgi:hypothetical protein
MYQNSNGERRTLFLRARVGGETAFRYHEGAVSVYSTGRMKALGMRPTPRRIATCCCASPSSSTGRPRRTEPAQKIRPHRKTQLSSSRLLTE